MSAEQTTEQTNETIESISALQIAQGLKDIYDGFTDEIRSMGSKKDGKITKSPFAQSALQWITGGRVRTERDIICDKFLQDVQKQLETLSYALEGLPQEQVHEAVGVVADIMSQPLPAESNATTVLMKRAMIGQLQPYLPLLSTEQLTQLKNRLETSYKKSQRVPVEQQILKEIGRLLK